MFLERTRDITMKENRAVTIYDIAKKTELAPSTISKIINHKGNYPKETIDRVFSVVDELGYIPNIKARRLAEKSTKTIGVSFTSFKYENNTHVTNVLSGIINKAFDYGYNVTLFNDSFLDTTEMLSKIHEFDGIIFPTVSSLFVDYMAFLDQKNKPFVYAGSKRLFDQKNRNFYGGYYDYIQETLEIYYKKNRKRLVFFPQLLYSDFKRYDQRQLQTMIDSFTAEYGLPDDYCILDKFTGESAASLIPVIDKYFQSDRRPDALFFNSMPACITVYNYLQQQGLRIPEDVAIICTGQTATEGMEFSPTLSTIHVHAYEMGLRAMELLMHQINPEEYPAVDNNVPYTYIERESSKLE